MGLCQPHRSDAERSHRADVVEPASLACGRRSCRTLDFPFRQRTAQMTDAPSSEEAAIWQRRLAAQANNRAWRLSESLVRSPEEDEEMLQAAHAAMYFWKMVGSAGNRAHAAQLLAHVYALLEL